jgi:hypothetical protein
MAKLKNTQFATFDRSVWGKKDMVMVGHNRTLQLVEDAIGQCLQFRLHGHCVVAFWRTNNGTFKLVMDACGYPTTTTREAIKDAVHLFGYAGGVSFAKGGFKARLAVKPYSSMNPEGFEWLKADYADDLGSNQFTWEA